MPSLATEVFAFLGLVIRAVGFLAVGYALGRLVFEHFRMGTWQLQVAYVLGLFVLLIGLTASSSPASSGCFAIGIAVAYFTVMPPQRTEPPAP